MSLEPLLSTLDVAEALGETEYFVKQKCRRREWPHRRTGRGRVSFTEADYAEILRLIAVDASQDEPTGLAFAPRSRRSA